MISPTRQAKPRRGTVAGTEKPLSPLWKTRWLAICLGSDIASRVGLAGPVSITELIQVFKTGVSSDPAQAGSIPVRLR
jgi:hypothetical protein